MGFLPETLEVVSKPQIRLKSKARADKKAVVCEHFEEAYNAAIKPKMGF
jgi:hypothetical protein